MPRIELPSRPRVLIVVLRRLGDVLLSTPLIRSVRQAWPDATVDALVFDDTAGILAGNPDLSKIIGMPAQPTTVRSVALAARLWRRYDLAVSTQSGDRPTFFAAVAGRRRAAVVEATLSGRVKRAFVNRGLVYGARVHRVEGMLRIADLLGIPRSREIVCPAPRAIADAPSGDYAVIHAAPMFCYKQWTADGWRALAVWLGKRGLRVVASGGPDAAERRYLDDVWQGTAVRRLDGQLDWPQVTSLLAKAQLYVGPDTSVTHLAAATGCPTVAVYGPTDPRSWGPWPQGGLSEPWEAAGHVQRRGNVWLVQNPLPCTPCQLEGCERRLDSYSACLDELPANQVMAAMEEALDRTPA